jgi:hypothetical protein
MCERCDVTRADREMERAVMRHECLGIRAETESVLSATALVTDAVQSGFGFRRINPSHIEATRLMNDYLVDVVLSRFAFTGYRELAGRNPWDFAHDFVTKPLNFVPDMMSRHLFSIASIRCTTFIQNAIDNCLPTRLLASSVRERLCREQEWHEPSVDFDFEFGRELLD